jgi:hypothetical protein
MSEAPPTATGSFATTQTPASRVDARLASKNLRIAAAIGAAATVIGGLGPWITMLGAINISATANAESAGFVFGGAALMGLGALRGQNVKAGMIIGAILVAIQSVYSFVKLQEAKDAGKLAAELVQPGWGLYLCILAAAATFIAALVIKAKDA